MKLGFLGSFKVGALNFGGLTPGRALLYTTAGPPTNGSSGTLAGIANIGSLLADTVRGTLYINMGTMAAPVWVAHSLGGSARAKYDFAVDGGAIGAITPATTAVIPANAIVTNVIINALTAVTSAGSATVAIGTTAGSSATAFLAATAKTSFSTNALVQGVPVPSDATKFVKLSAAGSINISVATAALTAGVIEITAQYVLASA